MVTIRFKIMYCLLISLSEGLAMNEARKDALVRFMGHLLCRLRYHDFKVIDRTFEFGSGGMETVECRRCEIIVRRSVN